MNTFVLLWPALERAGILFITLSNLLLFPPDGRLELELYWLKKK